MKSSAHREALEANDRGRFLDAFEVFERTPELHPLVDDPDSAEVAIRVCSQLCLRGLAMRIQARLVRKHPDDPRTHRLAIRQLYYAGRHVEAFRKLTEHALPKGDDVERAKWHSLRARVFAVHRDFERVRVELDEGVKLWSSSPWVPLDRVALLRQQDQPEQALELARQELEKFPHYVPMRSSEAELLLELDRGEEAAAVFAACSEEFQSPYLEFGRARCLRSLDRPREAMDVYVQVLETYRLPLGIRLDIRHELALLARIAGDTQAALRFAGEAGEAGRPIAAAIEASDGDRPRVQLEVPFVRQDHVTCAPATHAANLRFFGVEVDQREVADEITYAGTAEHDQLRWAERQGLRTRFFEFEPTAAFALLEEGLPFTLSTRFIGGAHLQGVIGYDPVLGTLLLREPGQNLVDEVSVDEVVRQQAANGGGCSIIYPPALDPCFPGEGLPNEEASLELVLLREDLELHRLPAARKRLQRIEELGAESLLIEARYSLAGALERNLDMVALDREQLARAPEDRVRRYCMAASLLRASQWGEHRTFLEAESRKPDCPPELRLELAELLSEHAATRPRAETLVLEASRWLSATGGFYCSIALVHWRRRHLRGVAVDLYRFAACLDIHNEGFASAYFNAALQAGRADEALLFLRQRLAQLGAKSALSAGGVAFALEKLRRPEEAIEVLAEALAKNDDPWVSSTYLRLLIDTKRFDEAARHLEATRSRRLAGAHLREVAKLARARGELEQALEALDGAFQENDQDEDLVDERLELLFELGGSKRAVPEALAIAGTHAGHPAVLSVVTSFLTKAGATEEAEVLLTELVKAAPSEHWLKGKLASLLLDRGRIEEAHVLLEQVLVHYPDDDVALFYTGRARALVGDREGAREALRRSLEIDPDQTQPLEELLQLAEGPDEALFELRFLATEFRRHSPTDGTLRSFLQLEGGLLPRDELRALLTELEANDVSNPELGMALFEFLVDEDDLHAAAAKAAELRQRFPRSTEVGLLLARSHCLRGEKGAAKALLSELTESDPRSAKPYFKLGELLEAEGNLAAAEHVYQRGAGATGHASMYGCLAEVAWRRGQGEVALEALARAIEAGQHYTWAHSTRADILRELGRGAEALSLAREVVQAAPTWSEGLLELARQLGLAGENEECVEVLERALELEPRLGSARRDLVRKLSLLGRFEQARAAVAEGRRLLGVDYSLEFEALVVERLAGDPVGAREGLAKLLGQHPTEFDGWSRLLQWLEADDEGDQLVALFRSPPAGVEELSLLGGYAADVFAARGEVELAIGALERALAVDPDYGWARCRLSELLASEERYDEEGALLESIEDPDSVYANLAGRVAIYASRTKDAARAARFLRRLLRDRSAQVNQLAVALRLFRKCGKRLFRKTIGEAELQDSHGIVAAHLASAAARSGRRREFRKRLGTIWATDQGGPQAQSRLALVCSSADETALRGELATWLERHLEAPIENLDLWGIVGHINRNWTFVIQMMHKDWQRPGVEQWMLSNLCDALLAKRRYDEMEAVSGFALGLSADATRFWHQRAMALAHVRRREYEAALEFTSGRVGSDAEVLLALAQLDLVARLGLCSGHRAKAAVTRAALPELIALSLRASSLHRKGDPGTDFRWRIFRAGPSLLGLLFLSRPGRWALRRWLSV